MAINAKVLDDFKKNDWGGLTEKPAMVLTYIVFEGHYNVPPERRELEDIFFSTSTKDPRKGLNNVLKDIRSAVGKNNFIHDGEVLKIEASNLYFDFLEFAKSFASENFEEAVKLYKGDFCNFYYDRQNRAKKVDSWLEEKRENFRKEFVEAVVEAAKSRFLKSHFGVASSYVEKALECLDLDFFDCYIDNLNCSLEVCYSLALLGEAKACIDKLKQYVQKSDLSVPNFPKDKENAMKFLESQWGKPNPPSNEELPNQDFNSVLKGIESLLEMDDSKLMKGAVSRVIFEEFQEKKESSKEIATYLVDSHVNGQEASEVISALLTLSIKDSQLLKEVNTDLERIKTRQAFTDLLGWVAHFALPNEDTSKYILDLEKDGIVVIPLEEAVSVEIFSAKATGRIAIFDRTYPKGAFDISGREATYLEASKFSEEGLQKKVLNILISFWRLINKDKELDDVKAEKSYEEWSKLGFREEKRNIPKFIRDLRACIKNKREAKESYPYIISQISSLSEEDFFDVCRELRKRVPFLNSVGFGIEDNNRFSSVFEEDIRQSIKTFFDVLERTFPQK